MVHHYGEDTGTNAEEKEEEVPMSDSQPFAPAEESPGAEANTASPDVPKKPQRFRWRGSRLAVVASWIFVVSCLACLAWVIFARDSWVRIVTIERPAVTAVADEFLRDLENKDADAAYALFSTRVQQQIALPDFEEQILDSEFSAHVEGYESLVIQEGGNFDVAWDVVSDDPLAPQGTVATLSSVVKYEGGFEGTLYAVFEKEDGEWRVYRLDITAEPDKINSP
jgi:hypothetical protein